MALLRPNRSVVHPRFLLYFYLSPYFQEIIARHTIHGATVPRIGLASMPSWEVEVPSDLREQQAIADVLGALDDKIAANHEVVRIAGQVASAFTLAASGRDNERLSAIAIVTMGASPPGSSYNVEGNGVPFYQGVRDFGERFPANRVWTTAPVRMAEEANTLISVRAPVGRTNLACETLCIGRGLASLRSRDARPYTLFHQIRATRDAWGPYEAEGTIFGSIDRKQLDGIRVPAIRKDCQEQLEAQLSGIERRIAAALRENRILAATRDELLPLLMSGRIRVRDAEKVVEEVV